MRNGGSEGFWGCEQLLRGGVKLARLSDLQSFALHHFGVPSVSANGPGKPSLTDTSDLRDQDTM